jgi:methionine-rich copper-binding protein CopC
MLAAAIVLPVSALAHAHLKSATPAPDSVVTVAPAEVTIDFTEALEPRFSSIQVKDSSGAVVDQGDVHVSPDDPKKLIVSLKPLTSGAFSVVWHATATDTHQTNGSYSFKVSPK